jgi:capsid protein
LDPWERWRLVNKSRATERENEWYDTTLGNFADLVVGSEGPEPLWINQHLPPDVLDQLQELWWEDATNGRMDVAGVHSWASMLKLRVRSVARDGDILTWHDGEGRAAHYETDQVGKVFAQQLTGIVSGFELNLDTPMRTGAPDAGGGAYVAAEQADFIAWRTRFGQTRGAPVLQSSMARWQRLSSLVESEIISSENSSMPWTVLTTAPGVAGMSPPTPFGETSGEEGEASTDDYDTVDGWVPTDAGHMMAPPRGVTATPWIPNRPNLDVPPFVKMNLRRFVAPLCPYEALFSDFEGLSYATIRGLGQAARNKVRHWRGTLLQRSLDRQARDWLTAAVKDRRITLPAGLTPAAIRIEWRWEELDIRDREKDALTAEREENLGHQSMKDRLGPDWTRVQDQRQQERKRQAQLDAEYAKYVAGLNQPEPAPVANPEPPQEVPA